MKKQKGISLIVLIITIVVIIILATAIIVNIAKTDIIGNANEAVVKQDFKTFQEELDLYIANEFTKAKGEFYPSTINETKKEEVAKYIPSIKGTKYDGYVTLVNGKILLDKNMPGKEWADEVINSGNGTPIFKSKDTTAKVNSTFTGSEFKYNNPIIPVGFMILDDENGVKWSDDNNDGVVDNWNNGLAIVDEIGNEFVWVPCTLDGKDGTIAYVNRFDEYPKNANMSNVSCDENALTNEVTIDETEQIEKYGGFYIGRYEAGVPDKIGTPSNIDGTPVVQKDATVWTNISYNKAMPNAKKLYEESPSVRSGLVTGTGWDTVCAWIESEKNNEDKIKYNISNSIGWGNHKDSLKDIQLENVYKQTAGFSENWKAKNIYDFAGNAWEWTGEIVSNSSIGRSGSYYDSGEDYPAAYRYNFGISNTYIHLSFRIALYVI